MGHDGRHPDNNNGRSPRGPRCIALVGPFQSGKTSLLETLAGIRPADSDCGIRLDGQPLCALPPEAELSRMIQAAEDGDTPIDSASIDV